MMNNIIALTAIYTRFLNDFEGLITFLSAPLPAWEDTIRLGFSFIFLM